MSSDYVEEEVFCAISLIRIVCFYFEWRRGLHLIPIEQPVDAIL